MNTEYNIKSQNKEKDKEVKADTYDKEKDAAIKKQEPSKQGDTKGDNDVLLDQAETD